MIEKVAEKITRFIYRNTISSGTVYEIGTKWTEIRDAYNVVRLSATES